MRESSKIIGLVFISSVLPITIWNAIRLYLADSCDPKFGCLGVFNLLTEIVLICAFITTLAAFSAYYICVFRQARKLARLEQLLIVIFGFFVSIVSNNAIGLAQSFGISSTIATWVLASFAISVLIFKFGNKYNNHSQSDAKNARLL